MEGRLRIGLALCIAGAVAWVVAASLWGALRFELVDTREAQLTSASAWWIGLQALAVGAALVSASRVGRSGRLFGWGATVAFVLALFLQTASSAFSVASTHASQAADVASTCMRAAAWFGAAFLAVVLGRIGASAGRWAQSVGPWSVVIVPACAAVEQAAMLSHAADAARYGLVVVARLVVPLLIGTLVVAAWQGAPAASTDSRRASLADAVVAFPVLLAARCGLAFATGLVGSPADHRWGMRQAVVDDDLLGLAMLACAVRIAFAPARLRSRWGVASLACVVTGCLAALLGTGTEVDQLLRFGAASLGVVSIRITAGTVSLATAGIVAQVAGLAAICACTLAVDRMAEALGAENTERGVRRAVGAFVVASAATITVSEPSPALVAVALGACAVGIVSLMKSCGSLSLLLEREAVAAPQPEAPPESSAANPYAPPAGETAHVRRGGLGAAKLAPWRASVRDAIPWVFAPQLVCGVMQTALVWFAVAAGDPAWTPDGRRDSLLRAAAVFGAPLMTARAVARTIALAGVFAATASPRGRSAHDLPGGLRAAARVTAALSMAVSVATAAIAMIYGILAAADVGTWTLHADHVAYCAFALYGARLLAAGGREGAALLMKCVAAGFGLLTAACPLMLAAGKPFVDVATFDSYATGVLALFAIAGVIAMRDMLHDSPRAHVT